MSRFIILGPLTSLLLAACVQGGNAMTDVDKPDTSVAATASPAAAPDLGHDAAAKHVPTFPDYLASCDSQAVQEWIGRRFSSDAEPALLKASGTSTVRAARPGQPMSMDYQTDRLTVELDGSDIIVALRCG